MSNSYLLSKASENNSMRNKLAQEDVSIISGKEDFKEKLSRLEELNNISCELVSKIKEKEYEFYSNEVIREVDNEIKQINDKLVINSILINQLLRQNKEFEVFFNELNQVSKFNENHDDAEIETYIKKIKGCLKI